MSTRHQLARYSDVVEAIGMIALETVDLELELASLCSRMLSISRLTGEAIYMTPKADQARIDILRNAANATSAAGLLEALSRCLARLDAEVTRSLRCFMVYFSAFGSDVLRRGFLRRERTLFLKQARQASRFMRLLRNSVTRGYAESK